MTKDSKKKLRRWSFIVLTDTNSFHVPIVAFGSAAKAELISKELHSSYANSVKALESKEFKVEKLAHETISLTTQQQLDGMEFELKITSKALELATADLLGTYSEDELRKKVGEYVIQAKQSLIPEYFPEGSQVISESLEREKAALGES